jgi:predicted nuclease of predicted toxin-antitoxin system
VNLKLDENLGHTAAELFREAGHGVETVHSQRLSGAPDAEVIALCRREQRCLVTLDLDFSNPLMFKPWEYAGIAVLRLPDAACRAGPRDHHRKAVDCPTRSYPRIPSGSP